MPLSKSDKHTISTLLAGVYSSKSALYRVTHELTSQMTDRNTSLASRDPVAYKRQLHAGRLDYNALTISALHKMIEICNTMDEMAGKKKDIYKYPRSSIYELAEAIEYGDEDEV